MDVTVPATAIDRVVSTPRACIKCGYNVQGLFTSSACPECGTAVAESLRGDLLQHASADYIRTILTGHSWVLNSILVAIIVQVATVFITVASGAAGGSAPAREFTALASLVGMAVSVWGFLGYLKLTNPDPQFAGSSQPDLARRMVRTTACAQIGFSGVLAAMGAFATPTGPIVLVMGAVNVLMLVVFAVQFIAMMNYTIWLARRIPDAWVARRAGMYRWLLPLIAILGAVVFMLGPLVALVMYWNLLDRMRKHLKSIVATGSPAALKGCAA